MRTDREAEVVDGQQDFSGGMREIGDLKPNQYRYGKNIIIRNGSAETRMGCRRALRVTQEGLNEAFYFDEFQDRIDPLPDPPHEFWFDFLFLGASGMGSVQGVGHYRWQGTSCWTRIVCSAGKVFTHKAGQVDQIETVDTIAETETIEFIQAANWVVMLRSGDNRPLRWNGDGAGFVAFTAGTVSSVPNADNGIYHAGRLWLIKSGTEDGLGGDIYASNIFDIHEYDYVNAYFSVNVGDGDVITALFPFHDDKILVFKERSIWVISGITRAIESGKKLKDYISINQVSGDFGTRSRHAIAERGEQVYFLSSKGITSIRRVAEGNLLGVEVLLSSPIAHTMERIRCDYIEDATAVVHDNYLMFSVPLGLNTTNSSVLVYDLLMQTWIGEWTSECFKPLRFLTEDEDLFFLGVDGTFRQAFIDSHFDSLDPIDDTPAYDNAKMYSIGDRVTSSASGEQTVYRAIKENFNVAVTDAANWIEEYDPYNLYQIETEVRTRFYEHGDKVSPKRLSRCQVGFSHQNPKITIDVEDRDVGTRVNVFTDKTYSRTVYDTGATAWVTSNGNDDFTTPHRQDYTLFLGPFDNTIETHAPNFSLLTTYSKHDLTSTYNPDDSFQGIYESLVDSNLGNAPADSPQQWRRAAHLLLSEKGVALNLFEHHDLRFIPRVVNNTAFALRIRNTTGSLRITSIIAKAQQGQFAKRNR